MVGNRGCACALICDKCIGFDGKGESVTIGGKKYISYDALSDEFVRMYDNGVCAAIEKMQEIWTDIDNFIADGYDKQASPDDMLVTLGAVMEACLFDCTTEQFMKIDIRKENELKEITVDDLKDSEFHIGDEITNTFSGDSIYGVIINIEKTGRWNVLFPAGIAHIDEKSLKYWRKTGNTFPEIAAMHNTLKTKNGD